ncbi:MULTISPECIES: hypothetical protein [unclassified Streptomyces]|uniref:hypothetical protein n=1 Tax=unclassified Streptomyces TaxID=2593676 RepID=UPI0030E0AE5F
MTAHHAIEITLTRPAADGELRRARRVVALAGNSDGTRLLALQRARTPGRALRALRRRLDGVLPIDVLTTHYPDRRGCVLLNFALSHTARTTIRQAAETCGQRPRDFLKQTVIDAVAQHKEERVRRLMTRFEGLLAQHTPEELLACAARTLLNHGNRLPSDHSQSCATPS